MGDEAKQRVVKELEELNEKMGKLSFFLFSPGIEQKGISRQMRMLMRDQLGYMQSYAETLQRRLAIWGKTDIELNEECKVSIY